MQWLPAQGKYVQQASDGGSKPGQSSPQEPLSLLKRMQAVQRIHQQHFQMRREMGGNFCAPLTELATILDVGCSNGRWAMEMAVQFPSAHVVGIDIVMPAPFVSLGHGLEQQPANVTFLQGDVLKRLPFPDASFDFVYIRLMYSVIPASAWGALMREMIRVTRPGGWVESLELLPYAVQQKEGMVTIIGWYFDVLRRQGAEPMAALKMPHWMRAGQLERVTTRKLKPAQRENLSDDEKRQNRDSALALIEDIREPLLGAQIASPEEYARIAAKASAELHDSANPGGFHAFVSFGQRSLTS